MVHVQVNTTVLQSLSLKYRVLSLPTIITHKKIVAFQRKEAYFVHIFKATFEIMITRTNKLEEIQLMFMYSGKFKGIKIDTIKIRNNLITLNS